MSTQAPNANSPTSPSQPVTPPTPVEGPAPAAETAPPSTTTQAPATNSITQAKSEFYYQKACADGFGNALKDIRCYSFGISAAYYRVNSDTEAYPWGHQGPRFAGQISVSQQFGKRNRAYWGLGVFGGGSSFTQSLGDPGSEITSSARTLFGGLQLHLGIDAIQKGDGYKIVSFAAAIGAGPAHLQGGDDGFRFSTIGGGNPVPDISNLGAIINPQLHIAFARNLVTLIGGLDFYMGLTYQASSQVPDADSPPVSIPVQGLFVGGMLDVKSSIEQIVAAARGNQHYFLDKKRRIPKTKVIYVNNGLTPTAPSKPQSNGAQKELDKLIQANITLKKQAEKLHNIKIKLDSMGKNVTETIENSQAFKEFTNLARNKKPEIIASMTMVQTNLISALKTLDKIENLTLTTRQNQILIQERSKLEFFITTNTLQDIGASTLVDIDFILENLQYTQYDIINQKNKLESIKILYPGIDHSKLSSFLHFTTETEGHIITTDRYLTMLKEIRKQFPQDDPNQLLVRNSKKSLANLIDGYFSKRIKPAYSEAKKQLKILERDKKISAEVIASLKKSLENLQSEISKRQKLFDQLK